MSSPGYRPAATEGYYPPAAGFATLQLSRRGWNPNLKGGTVSGGRPEDGDQSASLSHHSVYNCNEGQLKAAKDNDFNSDESANPVAQETIEKQLSDDTSVADGSGDKSECNRKEQIDSLLEIESVDEFLYRAFELVLHRSPDFIGNLTYKKKIEQNELSRKEVLAIIRYSREGKKIGVEMPGFLSYFILQRLIKFPTGLIRFAVRFFKDLINISKSAEYARSLEAYIKQQEDINLQRLNASLDQLREEQRRFAEDQDNKFERLESSNRDTAKKLSDVEADYRRFRLEIGERIDQLFSDISIIKNKKADIRELEQLEYTLSFAQQETIANLKSLNEKIDKTRDKINQLRDLDKRQPELEKK